MMITKFFLMCMFVALVIKMGVLDADVAIVGTGIVVIIDLALGAWLNS